MLEENLTIEEIIEIIDIVKKQHIEYPDKLILKSIKICFKPGIERANLIDSVIKRMETKFSNQLIYS